MTAAAILKCRDISAVVGPILTKFGTMMQFDPPDQNLKFLKSKMAAAAILKKHRKIAIFRPGLTDFDKIWHD